VAYVLFVNGSGFESSSSPYEVVAGVIVEDRDLWNFVQAVLDAKIKHLSTSALGLRLTARRLLKRKVFRLARQLPPLPLEERHALARACLEAGERAGKREMTALAQSKLAYVGEVLEVCARFRCRFVASIVPNRVVRPAPGYLRKDYAYLFERFFFFLEDQKPLESGFVLCTARDTSTRALLSDQMQRYFKNTVRGRQRASLILPDPLTVDGDLAVLGEVAGLVAYITAWGFRTRELTEPARHELLDFKEQVRALRYRAVREIGDNTNFVIWGFTVVSDLRTREEREQG